MLGYVSIAIMKVINWAFMYFGRCCLFVHCFWGQ